MIVTATRPRASCKVFPLAERESLTRADEILIDPDASPPPCSEQVASLDRRLRAEDPRPPADAGRR